MSTLEIIIFCLPLYFLFVSFVYKYALMICIEDGDLTKGSFCGLKVFICSICVLASFWVLVAAFFTDMTRGFSRPNRGIHPKEFKS